MPAARAARASTSESPTKTQSPAGIFSESAACSSPSGAGLGRGTSSAPTITSTNARSPSPLEGVLDTVPVLGRHHPDPIAGFVKCPEHPCGARQEDGAGDHHLVRPPDEMLEELLFAGPPLLARQNPERRVEIEPDGPADGVRRSRREPQAGQRVIHADDDAFGRIRQREVEVEKHCAGGRDGVVHSPLLDAEFLQIELPGPQRSTSRHDPATNPDRHRNRHEPLLAPFDGVVIGIQINPETTVPGVRGQGRSSAILFRRVVDGELTDVHVAYVHVREVLVSQGDTVRAGDPVARIGNNGSSFHPHVHVGAFRGDMMSEDAVPLQVRMDLEAMGRIRERVVP